jgi:Transposase
VQTVLHIDGEQLFVGIDWGASHHQLCVVDADGAKRRQIRLAHDVAGLARLDHELGGLGARLPVAVERAEGLLVEHLQARGHLVYPVSPRIAARARERYRAASSKDDVFDASCWPTPCATSTPTGGRCRSPASPWPSCGH